MKRDYYKKLHNKLSKLTNWPTVYMFKFIIPAETEKIKQVEALFPDESELSRKYSTAGKYVSITCKEVMMSADEVVERYARAATIEGIIAL